MVGPVWTAGAPLVWMSHAAPWPDSVVQPQNDEESKLQANHTYAAAGGSRGGEKLKDVSGV